MSANESRDSIHLTRPESFARVGLTHSIYSAAFSRHAEAFVSPPHRHRRYWSGPDPARGTQRRKLPDVAPKEVESASGQNERGRAFMAAFGVPDILTQMVDDAPEELDALQEIFDANVLVRAVRVR